MEISSRQKRGKSEILPELEACPFLGLEQDSATWLAYAHPANFCHRAKPIRNLSLGYQETTCLTKEHTHCPGYINGWNGPLPEEYSGEKSSAHPNRNLIFPGLVIIVLFVAIAGWFVIRRGWLPFIGSSGEATQSTLVASSEQAELTNPAILALTNTATPTVLPTSTPNRQQTQTAMAQLITPSPSLAPTQEDTPTPAPPTPGPEFDTPFGPDSKYILHKLEAGESMGTLTSLYNTTNRVIEASNVLIPGASIWPGTVLVIVPGEKNPEAVIRFRVMFLESAITVEDLVSQYNVTAEDIRLYNSLGPENYIPAGRFIIIPAT